MNKFWMVFNPARCNMPTKQHFTLEEAKLEASRLSQKHSELVCVLECIGGFSPIQPPVEWSNSENVPVIPGNTHTAPSQTFTTS